MVDVLTSTQERRLTFFDALKMSWDLLFLAFGLSVGLMKASLLDGVTVNSTVTAPRNARGDIESVKKLVVTIKNAEVTFQVKMVASP